MGFNFPAAPIIGEVYPTPAIPGVPQYMWDGEVWGSTLDVVNPALFVMKSGDTMSGDLVLTKNAPQLVLDRSDTTTNASLVGKVGGIATWSVSFEDTLRLLRHDGVSTHALMVGNWIDGKVSTTMPDKINLEGRWALGFDGAGDDLYIERYDDDGVPLGRPISIERVTGLASVEGDPVAALGIATKQYVDRAGGGCVTDDVPPLNPVDGDFWWDSSAAQLYIFYADETSGQWVSASSVGPQGPAGGAGPAGPEGPAGPAGDISLAVMKTGDTMTGPLTVPSVTLDYNASSPSGGPALRWQGPAGGPLGFYVNGGVGYQGDAGNPSFQVRAPTIDLSLGPVTITLDGPSGLVTANGLSTMGLLNVRPDLPQGNYSCSAYLNFVGGGQQYGLSMRVLDDGNPNAITFNNSVNTAVGAISQNASSVAYSTSSSGELKENLTAFDAGPIIDAIEVWHYTWKATGEPSYGVIAQQVDPIYPIAVRHILPNTATTKDTPTPEWWGVDYSKFVPLLLQEVKALRARVAVLEAA